MKTYICILRYIAKVSSKNILANSCFYYLPDGKITWRNIIPDENAFLEDWEVGQLLGGN